MRKSAKNKKTDLYLVTNTKNGKRYVGVTCKGVSRRIAAHVCAANRAPQGAFHRAIRKHGMESFFVDTLETFDGYDLALMAEVDFIAANRPEYNCTKGGDGAVGLILSDEAKEKMSRAKRGKPSHMLGKRHTPEARARMSASLKGKPAYWKGKKIPEHVHAARKAAHALWVQDIEAVKAALKPAWEATRRRVICLNDEVEFESVTSAAECYGLDTSSIVEVCQRGVRKMAGGLVFRYANEPHGGHKEAVAVAESVLASRRRTAAIARSAKVNRLVRCINDGKIFSCASDAADFYSIKSTTVYGSCLSRKRGKRSYSNSRAFEYCMDGV